MASGSWSLKGKKFSRDIGFTDLNLQEILRILIPDRNITEEKQMSKIDEKEDDTYINAPDAGDDFDFVMADDDDPAEAEERMYGARPRAAHRVPHRRRHRCARAQVST